MTTETLWIVVAVVAALVLIALVVGLILARRRRRISLREPQEDGAAEAPRRGGTYQAGTGFSFSAGTGTATPPRPREPRAPDGGAAPARPGAPETGTAANGATAAPTAPTANGTTAAPARPDGPAAPTAPPANGTTAAPTAEDAARADTAPPPADTAPADTAPPSEDTTPAAADTAPADTAPAPADTPPAAPPPPGTTPDTRTGASSNGAATAAPPRPGAAPDTGAPAPAHPATTVAPPEAAAPTAPIAPATPVPTEPIAPTAGRLERLRGKLARSRSGFGQGLLGLLGAGELDEDSWEDVEATLLQADLGPEMTAELVERLRSELASRGVRTAEQARTLLRDVLTDALAVDLDRSVRALPHDGRPAVLLVVGVNGTGKTTTTGKLARVLVADGRHVVLGAADTFRAAAAEQLATWGERAGATVVRGPEGADPASVAFDAVKQAHTEGADAVLLDTAGRLHTKTGLMDELGKVKRVVSRQAEVDEVLLVLDATTGQNGLMQARVFGEVVEVTGIVLTKLDGTAKGGIVFRVQRELGVPVKLVGLGEGPDDLA
ncbi:MAG: signal recognition particle-docking protein FtsY, partial [Pseudonocardia sp.]